ncbi:MAG: hypothetical protein ACM3YM_07705 [Sphingomonadales bacterium]
MKSLTIACLLLVSSAAIAQGSGTEGASASEANVAKQSKQDRVICENQEELGSRLRSHRVCMRASEWAEKRRLERMEIQKQQTGGQCLHSGSGC